LERARIKTYVAGFDDSVGGGFPQGYNILVCGQPGTMKSTFTFSIAYQNALHHGMKAAYITLEQGKDMLLEHMHSLGMTDPKAYEHLSLLDMGTIRKNLSFLQAKGSWLDLFKMYANNLVKAEKVQILILDSLDVLEVMAKFEDRRTDLYYLFEWLRGLGVTSLLISEKPIDPSPTATPRDEAYLADGIIHLGLHHTSDVYVQRRIRCVKMRSTKHETGYYALIWEDGRFEVTRAVSGIG
jgi:KaiC/GvpD/RAD55 family RecA-like ATPase